MSSSNQDKDQILVLVSRFPYPLDKGDKLRAYHQLIELSKTFNITLVALTDLKVDKNSFQTISKYCKEIHIIQLNWYTKVTNMIWSFLNKLPFQVGYFQSHRARKKIKQLIEDNGYKHLYCQLIRTSEYIKDIHHIPKTIDFMDALSVGIKRRIEQQAFYKKWLFILESKRLQKYERSIFDYFENKTIISKQDRALINHPDSGNIVCIANGIDNSFFENTLKTKTFSFVFIGNMSYPPNVEAVKFIHNSILNTLTQCTLLVSGSSPSAEVKKIAEKDSRVKITGWVDDIRTSYAKGEIFLAPMFIGTGMQNKLLEAMAMGIPCVTTSLANNAIGAIHGEHIMVGNNSEEILNCIHQLKNNPALYQKISKNSVEFIKSNYSWEKSTKKLTQLIIQSNHN